MKTISLHQFFSIMSLFIPVWCVYAQEAPFNLPLLTDFNQALENSYKGAFHIPKEGQQHKQYPDVPDYGSISYGGNPNSSAGFAFGPSQDGYNNFFISGFGGAYEEDGIDNENGGLIESVSEYSIEEGSLYLDVPGNRSGYSSAVRKQDWLGVFDPQLNLYKTTTGANVLTGMYYNSASEYLYMTTDREYPNFDPRDNMIRISNPSKLETQNIEGYYQMQVGNETAYGSHVSSWVAEIPEEWRTVLGGKHLMGGGGSFSIISRLPVGPTLFTGNLDSLGNNGEVNLTRWMDFSDNQGEQFGAYLHGSPPHWYNYELFNCDRAAGYDCGQDLTDAQFITPWINDWWTILSYACQGFIMPGTRTYVVIGTYEGIEGTGYKAVSDFRDDCGGPCRIVENDYYNQYWLFDLKDIVHAENPYKVFPYEYGRITFLDPFLNQYNIRASILNAGYELSSNRLAVIMAEMEGLEPTNDCLIFDFSGLSFPVSNDVNKMQTSIQFLIVKGNTFSLSKEHFHEKTSVHLIDLNGKTLQVLEVLPGESFVFNAPKGLYLLNAINRQEVKSTKLFIN